MQMTGDSDFDLMGHLMRRAGFGATRGELEESLEIGYETKVEQLLNPSDPDNIPDDIIRRYHVDQSELRQLGSAGSYWMYRMISTRCPLEEKIALFWHGLFATGYSKLNQARVLLNQIDMFRRYGLGNFKSLLVELSKDPAMIIWLDNNDNHKGAVNENYGRELLELFSMGIGNYSENDVKECARAFTGWTLGNAEYMAMRASKDSIWPYGRIAWHYEYREDDHDGEEKTFLGETGAFSGEDVIEIIARQEATARFVATRLFQYFVADEITPKGEELIGQMMDTYFKSDYEIASVLRTMFNSEYFKSDDARYARIKGPVEAIVGTIRLAGSYRSPTIEVHDLWGYTMFMGQGLLNPPTVEGWHEGMEWIDSGSLVERVNFSARELSDVTKPGVVDITQRLLKKHTGGITPIDIVDGCLELMGPLQVGQTTRDGLIDFVTSLDQINEDTGKRDNTVEDQIAKTLGVIASTREYQLA